MLVPGFLTKKVQGCGREKQKTIRQNLEEKRAAGMEDLSKTIRQNLEGFLRVGWLGTVHARSLVLMTIQRAKRVWLCKTDSKLWQGHPIAGL